ncbi:MAG: hypothetical protein ABSG33_04005 [Candidatus Bathyarchaeia archaeon]|jgi:hypothetical protein
MNSPWENEFRHRIETFEAPFSAKSKGKAISIKIRVTSGCFHREHSPYAYRLIDARLESYPSHDKEFSFIEHESGPELLLYVALGTTGITLAKSVIDLITAIIKARSEGAKRGDRPDYPIELIVRGFSDDGKINEEIVLKFDSLDDPVKGTIEKALKKKIGIVLGRPGKKKKKA